MCSGSLITDPIIYNSVDSHSLYSVPENDTADSAYSSDTNGSPTTTGYSSNVNIPDLCRCPIPEEQFQDVISSNGHHSLRRLKSKNSYMSAEMEDTIHVNNHRPHKRSARHQSLNLENFGDARRLLELRNGFDDLLTRDSDVDSGVSCLDYDDPRLETPRNCYNDYLINGDAASDISWDDYSDLGPKRNCVNSVDQVSLINLAKPWEKLCTGVVSKAINQLTLKHVPKKIDEKMSVIEMNNIDTDDINIVQENQYPNQPQTNNMQNSHQIIRSSLSDIRLSNGDIKSSKNNQRSGKNELKGSRNDLRGSKRDLRSSKKELRTSKNDLRLKSDQKLNNKTEFRNSFNSKLETKDLKHRRGLNGMRGDLSCSNFNLSEPKYNSRSLGLGQHSSMSLTQLNLSLSRLDLTHETLGNENDLEERDVVYGDLTLPRRKLDKSGGFASLRRGNSFHMSFRMPRKRDANM